MTPAPAANTFGVDDEAFAAATDLDLRGLRCPMPVLRTRKALLALRSGELLRVGCTDPLAGLDIPHLVRETGNDLLGSRRIDAVQVFLIRKR